MEVVLNLWQAFGKIGQSVIAVVVALVVYLIIRVILLHRLEKAAAATSNDLDDRLVHFVKQFLWLIALFATVAVVLRINNIKISPLLAGAGIVGISLGFAAKETIADVLSGVFLIADRPVRVGDRVKIESIGRHWGAWGDVVDIGLRRTRVRNTDGVNVNYPNSVLANSVITNFSFDPEPVRVRVRFQLDYSADLELAEKVTIAAVEGCDGVIGGSAGVVVRSLWDDSGGHQLAGVLLEARYRIEDVRRRTAIRSQVLKRLLKELRSNKVPLATPRVRIES